MAEPRLATGFWVGAYRRRLEQQNIPCYVTSKGDETAGAVLVKLCTLDGSARLFERRFDLTSSARVWEEREAGPERDIDATLMRARATDPDLWVIEVEDRAGRHLLETPGLG